MKKERLAAQLADRQGNSYTLLRFQPGWFRLLPRGSLYEMTPLSLLQLFFRRRYGYTVYTAYCGSEPAGYCMLKNAQGRRYCFMDKHDVLISPYYVAPAYRGRGLSEPLLLASLQAMEQEKNANAYALVRFNNEASLYILDKLGFRRLGWLRGKEIVSEPTNVIVFRR